MGSEGDLGEMQRSILRMNPLRLSMLVAVPFVLAFGVINYSLQLYELSQIELFMVATLIGLLWWHNHDGPPLVLKNLFILHPVILFSFLFLQGGYSDIGIIWSFGFPFIACLSAGSRLGLIWTIIYALIIAALTMGVEVIAWQKVIYIGLAYLAFSLIAFYSEIAREKSELIKDLRLDETSKRLKKGEIALSESRISHRHLMDSLSYAIALHCDGKLIYCNFSAAVMFGADSPEELIGSSLFDYISADDHPRLLEHIKHISQTGRPAPLDHVRIVKKNSEEFAAIFNSSPVKLEGQQMYLVAMEDATEKNIESEERFNLRMQLEHSQRLESLGVLAGGIAHDFNNLLAAIMGNAELAKEKSHEQDPCYDHIENIIGSCDHAAELCKQMLSYAGKGSYELEVLNLNDLVKSMGKLIRVSVNSNIALKIKLDPNLAGLEGDMAQVQQLVLNFMVNSADAIGSSAGEIKVTTGLIMLDREALNRLYNGSELPEGEYVAIEIKDDGCGMDAELQAKIFDPFFTTKETGSGLGLSAVLGIVRGHHGAIQLISEVGKGTAFRVFFPSTDRAVKEKMVSTVEVEAWRGNGTVLVVDDDLRVRSVAGSFIERLNFDLLSADDGKEGLELFRENHFHLVAVLLDMTMPVMGGVDAMAGMREMDASVPIIIVSGYSEVEAGALVAGDRPDAFLQKPFKAKELKTALYEVMHRH